MDLKKNVDTIIIEHFSIEVDHSQISFISSDLVSQRVGVSLLIDSKCYKYCHRSSAKNNVLKTTLYFSTKADSNKFLEIGTVRRVFLNEIKDQLK